MRGVLLTAAGVSLAGLFPTQAIAVDYAQCREMLRTKIEMMKNASEEMFAFRQKHLTVKEMTAPGAADDGAAAVLEKKVGPPLWNAGGRAKIWSPRAIELILSAADVVEDMKAAGCPQAQATAAAAKQALDQVLPK